MNIHSALPRMNLTNKRVFLRADLNVPFHNGAIASDLRLSGIKPTIDMLLAKEANIILATHLGRPQEYDEQLSTKHLMAWFEKQGYSIYFEPDLSTARQKSFSLHKSIMLLENLRFYPGEKSADPAFAQQLAQLADVYINDAFGTLHRTDASVVLVPEYFSPAHRTFGLLIEQELMHAQRLQNPAHPFCLIAGGNKGDEKIALISCLLAKIDTVLLCPALVFSFLKSEEKAQELLYAAKKLNTTILFPVDYLVSTHNSFAGPFQVKKAEEINGIDFCVAIGPQTQKNYRDIILESKTIFYNGLMGDIQYPMSLAATDQLFKAMNESHGYSIVAGGDSSTAAQILGESENIDYLSTGGGALLAYLCNQKLPALEILINK